MFLWMILIKKHIVNRIITFCRRNATNRAVKRTRKVTRAMCPIMSRRPWPSPLTISRTSERTTSSWKLSNQLYNDYESTNGRLTVTRRRVWRAATSPRSAITRSGNTCCIALTRVDRSSVSRSVPFYVASWATLTSEWQRRFGIWSRRPRRRPRRANPDSKMSWPLLWLLPLVLLLSLTSRVPLAAATFVEKKRNKLKINYFCLEGL